jgi:hypothetical protein
VGDAWQALSGKSAIEGASLMVRLASRQLRPNPYFLRCSKEVQHGFGREPVRVGVRPAALPPDQACGPDATRHCSTNVPCASGSGVCAARLLRAWPRWARLGS